MAGASFHSLFAREFDVAVFGTGFTGYAAATRLWASGKSVLLVGSTYALLWEATRALENSALNPSADPVWEKWLAPLRERGAANAEWFNPAAAEAVAANVLHKADDNLRTLLVAQPVSVEKATDGLIAGVIVATKIGLRRVRARHWIDATETGWIARIANVSPRNCIALRRSIVLHADHAEALDLAASGLIEAVPEIEWLPSHRVDERRLRFPLENGQKWYRRASELLRELRGRTSGGPAANFLVSVCAERNFPLYGDAENSSLSAAFPENLTVLSPSCRGESLVLPSERFCLGARMAIPELSFSRGEDSAPPLVEPVELDARFDVVVAGAGTGGAAAAIAASRSGVRVLAFDAIGSPGGIGVGGGVCFYFLGASGGLQDEIDRRVEKAAALFGIKPGGRWHPEAKKFVLLELFEEVGVEFLGDSILCGVERDGRSVGAVRVASEGRLLRIPAHGFIDATGDGDLCAAAGAEFSFGREGDGRTLAYTQSAFSVESGPNGPALVRYNYDDGWVDATDAEDLTRARLSGVARYMEHEEWKEGRIRLVVLTPLLGLRQSRHIHSERDLTFADLVEGARFEDSIGQVLTLADTHSVDFEFENDEMAFYYWACEAFSHRLRSDLPYRMLIPRDLDNVWIACRAAGMEVGAAYGVRMQREMQRFGEAAGVAAALAVKGGRDARTLDTFTLFTELERTGCRPSQSPPQSPPDPDALLEALDQGLPGVHLWHLARRPGLFRDVVPARLESTDPRVSFYAASILAMWGSDKAEPRLLQAILTRETGPSPEETGSQGTFKEYVSLPYWLQAVVWLRRCGSAACLDPLIALARKPGQPLNVLTIVAGTFERLVRRLGPLPQFKEARDALLSANLPEPMLFPSRSLWKTLRGEPMTTHQRIHGASTAQDHSWQLHLLIARMGDALGLPSQPEATFFLQDPRAFVRARFSPEAR